MQLHFGTELMRAEWNAAVVCVGTFDGVHLGHQALIKSAVREARAKELPAVLVTFDRHPAAILAPERCPKAIASVEENLEQFRELGIAVAVVLPFDSALSQMSADRFLKDVLVRSVRAQSLVVGHDFAMGHDREGTTDWLRDRIPTQVIEPFEIASVRVSSSEIRRAVSNGDVERAQRLLGRRFAVTGVVVGGQKLGRQLGYPTANVARSFDQVMPLDGVYVAEVETPFGVYRSAVSIGVRPAVGGGARTIEAYLLDYPGDSLYGQSVRVGLMAYLRDEQNFPSLDALIRQIESDVALTRSHNG
jgi:riboflavin kinase/FMN adenylyltransferase